MERANDNHETGEPEQAHQLVAVLGAQARQLAAEVPVGLRRLNLRVGAAQVEIEWAALPADGNGERVSTALPEVTTRETTPSTLVLAPMVGTFYHAPEPGTAPFVRVGDVVNEDTVIGIIEAMKLMNKILAERSGVVTAVMVPDGDLVEYGQPLVELSSTAAVS